MSDNFVSFKCSSKNLDKIIEQIESNGGEVLYSSNIMPNWTSGPKYHDGLYEQVIKAIDIQKKAVSFDNLLKTRFKDKFGSTYSPFTIRTVLSQLIRMGKVKSDKRGLYYTDKPKAVDVVVSDIIDETRVDKFKSKVLAFIKTKSKRKSAATASEIISFVKAKKFSDRYGYKLLSDLTKDGLVRKVSYGRYAA